MRLLLDTTVLIDLLRKRNARRTFLASLVGPDCSFVVSAVSIAEVYSGLRPYEEAETEIVLSSFECLPVTQRIGHRAGVLKNTYARRGKTLALPDVLIAATAIEHQLAILTDNRKHFDLTEVILYPLP